MKKKMNLDELRLQSFVTNTESGEHVGGATLLCNSISVCETSPCICDIVVLTENCATIFC